MNNFFTLIISIFFGLMIIVLAFILILDNFQESIILECHYRNWTGRLTGGVEINCSEIYEDFFLENQWINKCSDFFFSHKPSCHTLCNIDCELENKKAGKLICVC